MSEPQSESEVNLKVTLKGRSIFQVELLLNMEGPIALLLLFLTSGFVQPHISTHCTHACTTNRLERCGPLMFADSGPEEGAEKRLPKMEASRIQPQLLDTRCDQNCGPNSGPTWRSASELRREPQRQIKISS